MEFVSLIISAMDQIPEQVFDLANNPVLREWEIKTVEDIADKTVQGIPKI